MSNGTLADIFHELHPNRHLAYAWEETPTGWLRASYNDFVERWTPTSGVLGMDVAAPATPTQEELGRIAVVRLMRLTHYRNKVISVALQAGQWGGVLAADAEVIVLYPPITAEQLLQLEGEANE